MANEIQENIKIERRWDRQRIEFLDMWVSIRESRIETYLYVKPTDRHMYVHTFNHLANVKKAIPYGLGVPNKVIMILDPQLPTHYQNMPIQIFWKFYHQKMKNLK